MKEVILISVTALVTVALASLYWAAQIPDPLMETLGQCVPIYYSGLECCK